MKISIATSTFFLFQCNFRNIACEDANGSDDGMNDDKSDNHISTEGGVGGVLNSTTNEQLFPYIPPEDLQQEDQGSNNEDSFSDAVGDLLSSISDIDSFFEPEGNGDSEEVEEEEEGDDFLSSFLDASNEQKDADWSNSSDLGGVGLDHSNANDSYEEDLLGILKFFEDQASDALQMVPPQLLQCVGLDHDNPLSDVTNQIYEKSCSEDESTIFKQKIASFDQCTGWNMVELINQLPSIITGNYISCLNAMLKNDPDEEDIKQCKDAFFGENPFASVIHDMILNSDNVCSCYKDLHESPLPECTLGHWPIPISGKAVNSFACIVSFGCKFADTMCYFEEDSLQTCLPKADEEYACDGVIDQCQQNESMLFAQPEIQIIPLPGVCRRVYSSSNKSELVERYDNFSGKCLKDTMDIWNKHVDFKSVESNDPAPTTVFKEENELASLMEMDEIQSNMKVHEKVVDESEELVNPSRGSSHQILLIVLAFLGGVATTFIAIKISNRGSSNVKKGKYGAIKKDELPELPPIEGA